MRQYSQHDWMVTAAIIGILLVLFVAVGIVNHGITFGSAVAGIVGGIVAVVLFRRRSR